MHKLYHLVPQNLEGSVLYPLNQLKETRPDLYAAHVAKYAGREHVLNSRITSLGCAWNDVLFFTAIHPRVIAQAFDKIGLCLPDRFTFFEIDASALDPADTSVWLMTRTKDDPGDYVPFDPEDLEWYAELPDATVDYYRARYERGERPLLFNFVPHILYRGTLDIRSAATVGP